MMKPQAMNPTVAIPTITFAITFRLMSPLLLEFEIDQIGQFRENLLEVSCAFAYLSIS